ncbi:Beta-lactamase domain family protein [Babesia bovis T2Bo]|uniref:Metallo-beta-lactamase domain-containing protein n=1 Tax=Babesia bovis TaxID=5865 RepID=A7AWV0_BABBO|nr:Beta-lactamase domain family protein [Babesia bovis T2Bo]EDO05528.1 Beta-lactamase domain family protein [Babesia bovis T2Bo]|eukprot:XP_001609096.1 hypothetical protein [Babesia bovis T2Bo]
MRLLPWFLDPWHARGDVSRYLLARYPGRLREKAAVLLCRKFPCLGSLLGEPLGKWPSSVDPAPINMSTVPEDESSITYLGHRTVYFQTGGASFLTDPVFSRRLFIPIFGLRRVTNRLIKYWQCPMTDFVLLSNNSVGCVDAFSMRRLGDLGSALVIGGMNISRFVIMFFNRYTYPLRWYETVSFGSVEVTFLPSFSNSGRFWHRRDLLLWGSFFVRSNTRTFYYGGRTAYSGHFREIHDFLKENGHVIDIAILPMGPIYHHSPELTPEELVKAHIDLGAKYTIPVGYDTFPLGREAYGELLNRLEAHIEVVNPSLRKNFIILREGETVNLTNLENIGSTRSNAGSEENTKCV